MEGWYRSGARYLLLDAWLGVQMLMLRLVSHCLTKLAKLAHPPPHCSGYQVCLDWVQHAMGTAAQLPAPQLGDLDTATWILWSCTSRTHVYAMLRLLPYHLVRAGEGVQGGGGASSRGSL
jgi:hypothetical protein